MQQHNRTERDGSEDMTMMGGLLPVSTLVYDDTFGGFLTAVFLCYSDYPDDPRVDITPASRHQPGMFSTERDVAHEQEKAERVWRGLRKHLGEQGAREIYATYLGESPARERLMLDYIRKVFATQGEVAENYLDETARMIRVWGRRLYREKHRHEAFVRFHQSGTGEFYALIEPDFDVLPLIIPHFRDRYGDQEWVIYDVKRGYGAHYDLEAIREVTLDGVEGGARHFFGEDPAAREPLFRELWKEYYHATHIPSRRNTRLHVRHMPKRYWKYLVEKEAA